MDGFIRTIKNEWKKDAVTPVAALSILIFCLLRIPSLIEPYWYGDEGIYGVIGRALDSGRILYKGIWDNKPPLLYIVYALFHSDLFWIRSFSLLFGVASLVLLYKLSKLLFERKISIQITVAMFAILYGLPLLEGNIANAENFMMLPILCAVYLFVSRKNPSKIIYAVIGVCLSIAILFKIVAVFDTAAIAYLVFLHQFDQHAFQWGTKTKNRALFRSFYTLFENEIVLGVACAVPLLITVLYFIFNHAFGDFFRAVFSQNVGYVGYGNTFIIPQGLLILKVLGLALFLAAVFRWRTRIGFSGVVIFTWFALSVFNAFFSERPYTHYLLVLLPSFCLLVGYLFEKTKMRGIAALLLVVTGVFIVKNFGFYRKIASYYENYIGYVFLGKSVSAYQAFFDQNTPRDYELARFVAAHTKASDFIFLWSDSGQIYVLSNKLPPGRYIVAYHITWFSGAMDETKQDLQRVKPKYIIDTKHTGDLGSLLVGYQLQYTIQNADIYERQF